jgi:GAF domain-containing protein
MPHDPWAESLAALSQYYVAGATLDDTLNRVIDLAQQTVPNADFVGITMVVEGRERTAVYTDPASPEIDQTQYDSGEGPCVAAFASAQTQVVDSTRTEERWPQFCRAALDHGILSTLSLPMVVETQSVGAMNFYSRLERGFPGEVVASAAPFAAQAAIALANAQAYWDATQLSARLSEAMEFRSIIEQAKGVLMSSQGCTADEAFQILVAGSQRENVKVRDLAQRIVARTSRRTAEST